MTKEAKTLLVLIPDRLSQLIEKGEIAERYYNPGNLFKEVHILMTNDDQPDPAVVQKTVGTARLQLHNLPAPSFKKTLGYQDYFLKKWAAEGVTLAREIRPQLIRCHGAFLNTYVAKEIKRELGVPYVVSMHINPDEDTHNRARGLKERIYSALSRRIEKGVLRNSDLVMPVYKPIVPYLERLKVPRFEVAYNVLNPKYLRKKENYTLHDPLRIVSVGRQFAEKNPENLIQAVGRIPNAHLTLVGDGAYHERLKAQVRDWKLESQVTFHKAIPNDKLCEMLPDFDVFAIHSEYWEINKSVLEALLTGLPCVINRRIGRPVPEFRDDFVMLVSNTVDSYEAALRKLISDHAYRERLGRQAYAHAQENWAPAKTEKRFSEIYRGLLA